MTDDQVPDAMIQQPENEQVTIAPAYAERRWRILGWTVWFLPMLVIAIMVAARPQKRTVTHLYHAAVQRWWERQPLYDGPSGMNYLPQFAVLFGPYHVPPLRVGDILWRCTAAAGLAGGLWLFAAARKNERWRAYVLVSLLMLPLSLPALRNGQANAHLGAVFLLAAWCLSAERWWLATLLLCLGVAIKPLGIAAVGLAWIMYPHLWWRLGLGLGALAVFPFLFGPPDYVWNQFVACRENLRQCSEVTEHRFADLNGLLRTFGIPLTGRASLAVRALAGAVLALLCWLAGVRKSESALARSVPVHGLSGALVWLGAAAGFLMLFNPMTEANSYVILAPVLALAGREFFIRGEAGIGWMLAAMVLTMGLLPNLLRHWLGNSFALAWHPAMTILFLGLLVSEVFRKRNEGLTT